MTNDTFIWFRGLAADRPAAPTAIDQAWASTDTGAAYVAKNTAGTLSWQSAGGGGGGGAVAQSYLGYNTVGASTEAMTGGKAYLKKITVSTAGLLTSIHAYIDHAPTQSNVQYLACWLMNDNAGTPLNVIGLGTYLAGQNFFPNSTPRWVSMPLGQWLAAADYWLAVQRPSDPGSDLRIYYDTGGSDKDMLIANPWSSDGSNYTINSNTNRYSIRADFIN